MHVGEKIKLLRRLKGLTQAELAERINKTRSLISHVEKNGKVHPETKREILKALNTTEFAFEQLENQEQLSLEPLASYKTEHKALLEEIEHLKREIETLKSLAESQKKLIEMLENRRK